MDDKTMSLGHTIIRRIVGTNFKKESYHRLLFKQQQTYTYFAVIYYFEVNVDSTYFVSMDRRFLLCNVGIPSLGNFVVICKHFWNKFSAHGGNLQEKISSCVNNIIFLDL